MILNMVHILSFDCVWFYWDVPFDELSLLVAAVAAAVAVVFVAEIHLGSRLRKR